MIPAIFGLSGPVLTGEERAFFREADPAGYILFGRNIVDRAQVLALTDALRAIHGRERLFIAIDQEGGRVARMRPPLWAAYPAGAPFARLWDVAPASAIVAARANAEALGIDLAEAGISVDCWPSADVRVAGAHDVIGDRAFGEEPLRVAALARAVIEGLAAAGVAGCVKHMPGHGRAGADSHKELPRVDADAAALAQDLAPFRSLCGGDGCDTASGRARALIGMTAHVLYPAWDAVLPATLSPAIIGGVIRGEIGFAGLLLSDDIDMQALTGTIPARASAAVAAGCDLALNCWGRMEDMIGIAAALPTLGAAAAARLATALAGTGVPRARDEARQGELVATRDALLALAPA